MRTQLLLPLLAAAILLACSESVNITAGNASATDDRVQVAKTRARHAGIDTASTQLFGDSLIVFENDMAVRLDSRLSETEPVLLQAVQRLDRRATTGQARVITVDLTALQNYPAWRAGALAAMQNWAIGGAYVRFLEIGPGAMVTVTRQSLPNNTWAIADLNMNTGSPRVGAYVYINSNPGPLQNANPSSTTFNVGKTTEIMMHELGHLIGVRHTNVWQTEGYGEQAELVSGTSDFDGSSLFGSVILASGTPRTTFSVDDSFLIRSFWPTDAPTLYAYGTQVYGTPSRGARWYAIYSITVGASGGGQANLVQNISSLEDEGFTVPHTPVACPQNFQQPGLVYYEARPVFDDYNRPTPSLATSSSRICM